MMEKIHIEMVTCVMVNILFPYHLCIKSVYFIIRLKLHSCTHRQINAIPHLTKN